MEKYTLALCDDKDFVHNRIVDLLNKSEKIFQIEFILLHFYSITEIIEAEATNQIDCLLLDMELQSKNLDEIAKKIWSGHRKYPIIMISNQIEQYQKAFQIGAFRFLTKPLLEQDFFEAIGDFLFKQQNQKKVRIYRNSNSLPREEMPYETPFIKEDPASHLCHSDTRIPVWDASILRK